MSALGSRMLKVNHAGEHGAVNIYRGQLITARFTATGMLAELEEFMAHEVSHREVFRAELARRAAPRCVSYWLCAGGGFSLGLITGLLGRKAIAATTVAVARVVLRHLEHQLEVLRGQDEDAVTAISAIIADERRHHDQSLIHAAGRNPWTFVLAPVVAVSTESVIWLGMHL